MPKKMTKSQFVKSFVEAETRSAFGRPDAFAGRYTAIGGDVEVAAEVMAQELMQAGVISESSFKVIKSNAKTVATVVLAGEYDALRRKAEESRLSAAQFRKALVAVKNGDKVADALEKAVRPPQKNPLKPEGIKKRLDRLRKEAEEAGIKGSRFKKLVEGWLASW